MMITVSISKFRQNVSDYLDKVQEGHRVTLWNAKRNEVVASIIPERRFDPEAYKAMLDRVAGTFSAKNHPEWRTKRQVIRWVEKSRAAADRTF